MPVGIAGVEAEPPLVVAFSAGATSCAGRTDGAPAGIGGGGGLIVTSTPALCEPALPVELEAAIVGAFTTLGGPPVLLAVALLANGSLTVCIGTGMLVDQFQ